MKSLDVHTSPLILFDYGGTLDVPARHWSSVLWEAYQHAGVKTSNDAFREAYVYAERKMESNAVILPEDDFKTVLYIKALLQLDFLKVPQTAFYAHLVADYCDALVHRNLVVTRFLLTRLSASGYKLGVVSNFYGNLSEVLKRYALSEYFAAVIDSTVVGFRKPSPEIWQCALDQTGFSAAQTLVVGDSFNNDVVPAHQLGCQTVWLKGEMWKPQTYDMQVPDFVVTSLDELSALLR